MATIKGKELIDNSVTNNKLEESTVDFLSTLSSINENFHSDITIDSQYIKLNGNIVSGGSLYTGGRTHKYDMTQGAVITDQGSILLCGENGLDDTLKIEFLPINRFGEFGISAINSYTDNTNLIDIYNANLSVNGIRVPILKQSVVSIGINDWLDVGGFGISVVRYDGIINNLNITANSLLVLRRGSGYITELPNWTFEAIATGENTYTIIGKSSTSAMGIPESSITFIIYSIA